MHTDDFCVPPYVCKLAQSHKLHNRETEIEFGCGMYKKTLCPFPIEQREQSVFMKKINEDPQLYLSSLFKWDREVMLVHTRLRCWTICPSELFATISRLSTAACNKTSG
ncbi:hypothetical protein QQF64_033385 [Cirrhinus molitorella]|uniref:Uncharacterized protein n=1 Tax=Cirrhinus molitorella TaxID=172907 RepID=A0ABR3MTQ3_9TELE